jgi:CMP-N-acetylneuraminic acid synthetase
MAGVVRRAIVSTDDREIADVARAEGVEVPFLRPAELADDRAKMAPVLRHAVLEREAAEGARYDWVLLLQPTSPFRTLDDLRAALRLAEAGGCDSVISVVRVFDVHPMLMKRIESDRLVPYCVPELEGTRRQDYDPPAYMRNGAIYLSRRDVLVERGSIWGDVIRPYVMPEERSVSIDTELHLRLVDLLLRERGRERG